MSRALQRQYLWHWLILLLCLSGSATAAVRLDIAGAPAELRDNIRAHVGELPGDASDAGRRLQQRILQSARRAANALGYYNSGFDLQRARVDDDVVLTLHVIPGERVRITVADIQLLGAAADDAVFQQARDNLPLKEGRALNHGEYESAKRNLQNLALRRGYFDARFDRHQVLVDAVDNTAQVELEFNSGERYRLGKVSFTETHFDEELLYKMVPFKEGEYYNTDAIVEFNRTLLESQYFSSVRVRPMPDQASDQEVPIEVSLQAAEPNQLGLGLGYSTDIGPRGQINWQRRWVNRRGHSAGAQLELSQPRQTLETKYRVPLSSPINDVLEFQLGLQDEELQDTESRRATFSVQRLQRLQSGWRRTVSIRWDYTDFSVGDEHETTTLILPGLGYSRTRTSGGVDPLRGDRLMFNTEVAFPELGSDIQLQYVRLGARWLHSVQRKHRILLRTDAGALATSNFDKVPPALRFFAGGDQSVRGFAYNSVGPRNAENDIIGGRYLLTGSAEYAYQFHESWRLALFVDAGNAMNSFDADPKVGTGFGIHWISPVGPIRLDFAWGVSEDKVPFRLHFSMGPQL